MKRFLITMAVLLSFGQAWAQSDWKGASEAFAKFENSASISDLEAAKEIIDKAVTGLTRDAEALLCKGQIYAACAANSDPGLSDGAFEEAHEAYSLALQYDKKMRYRHIVLSKVYDLKVAENQKGIDHYMDKDYAGAVPYYKNAKLMNDLELEYPRMAPLDSTVLYSIAINSKLAGNNQEAIKYYEKLVSADYNNKEIYSSLIQLYGEQGQEAKVQEIEKKMKQKFPGS